ncbi:hypothetical protein GcM3_108003 [Golovinomyces cichoracearum]|uniref:Uncharacterized protein n=1 Tax=Golovinomyces cichoracearum TaxID=62708 RepID=A0A420I978_9PEZI|nr:hypothetical protein GcM3_108003 [Golovinomyces cichoracearum]
MSSSSPSGTRSLSKGAIGGIVSGILVTVLISGIIIFTSLRRKKTWSAKNENENITINTKSSHGESPDDEAEVQSHTTQELSLRNTSSQSENKPEVLGPTLEQSVHELNFFSSLRADHTIRTIPEHETEDACSEKTRISKTRELPPSSSGSRFELPLIYPVDQSLPIPSALLSSQTTLVQPSSISKESTPERSCRSLVNPSTNKNKISQNYVTPNFRVESPLNDLDSLSEMKGSILDSYSSYLEANQTMDRALAKERGRESPILGFMNNVKINDKSPPPLIFETAFDGRSRSVSDKSKDSINSMNQKIVSDEELERLGVGLRI